MEQNRKNSNKTAVTKQAARARALAVWSTFDARRLAEVGDKIADSIAESEIARDPDAVLLYAATPGEIPMWKLARGFFARGVPVAFPKCDPMTHTMRFYAVSSEEELTPGAYGIPEPDGTGTEILPTAATLCVVPGLAFDKKGYRLGRGGGYYDRFLADFPGVSVGVALPQTVGLPVPLGPFDRPVSRVFTGEGEHSVRARIRPLFASPWVGEAWLWLVFCVELLLLAARAVRDSIPGQNPFLSCVLLQIMVFLIPASIFCRAKGTGYFRRFKWHLPSLDRLPALVFAFFVLCSGCLCISLLLSGMESLSGTFSLYGTFVAQSDAGAAGIVYRILAFAVLPALSEELLVRGILTAELEKHGVAVSVLVSAVFFGILHFSLANLPVYLFAGIVLSAVYYATRSLTAVILLHFAYNLFCIFGQPYLTAFYTYTGNTELVLFLLLACLLVFAALFCGQAAGFYRGYADRNLASLYHKEGEALRTFPRRLFDALGSPICAVCIATFLLSV